MFIHIFLNDEKIAECDWVYRLFENYEKNNYIFQLINVRSNSNTRIKRKNIVTLKYMHDELFLREIELTASGDFYLSASHSIFGIFSCHEVNALKALDLMLLWLHKEINLSWRNGDRFFKETWLLACLLYKPIVENKGLNERIQIHGREIISREDFFCLLGEEFWGKFGYMGQDLDGFEDCLKGIINKYKKLPLFVISDKTILMERMKNFSPNIDFFDVFVNILIDNKCIVEFT